jgi:multidrug efflux system membrane fusion protein
MKVRVALYGKYEEHIKVLTQGMLLLMLACLLMSCEKPVEKGAAPRPALVKTIGSEGVSGNMVLVGEIKPRYESPQGFRVAGKIISRAVDVGTLVKKGQTLAKLDSADANLVVQASQADIEAAEAQLNLAKANLARQQQLMEKKFISAAALDGVETNYKAAKARLQQVRAQALVSSNQSRYTTLTAGRDGVVTMIRAEPGQVVEAGEEVLRIIDPKQLEVHIPVPESRMAKLAVNDKASMRLWAKREKTYQVKVREIAPAADAVTRTFLVKLSILDADEEVRLGMTAGVRLNQEQTEVILVPSPAVMQQNNQAIVWVVDAKNQVHPKVVSVTQYREDGAQISSGLQIGDKVVVAGAQALVEGQTVRSVEAQP